MAELSEEVKTFIVQHLAMFDTPSQVAEAVMEEFGVMITRQKAEEYNPYRNGKKPGKKWLALFDATRKAFLDKMAEIPTANKAVRLRRLDRMAAAAEKRGNYVLARELLEQIAKECGDAFTNKRRLVGGNDPGDVPIGMTFVPDVPAPMGAQKRDDDGD